jgi:tetratricopeptide (TPR) repeat protein
VVRLWEIGTGRLDHAFTGHRFSVNSVAFSPDGTRLVSTAEHTDQFGTNMEVTGPAPGVDQTVIVWDIAARVRLFTATGHQRAARAARFTADGKRLVTAGSDRTVRVWDAATGQPVLTLRGHTYGVLCLAVSPDGRFVASASGYGGVRDGEVLVWDAAEPWEAVQHMRRASVGGYGPLWHDRESRDAEAGGHWFAAVFHLSRLIETSPPAADRPDSVGRLARRARAYAEMGDRERAERDCEEAKRLRPAAPLYYRTLALVRLRLGDHEGYRAICREMLNRFGADDRAVALWQTTQACALLPAGAGDPAAVVGVARRAVAVQPAGCIAHHNLGAALYRAGRYDEALRAFADALARCRRQGTAWDWYWLAMAHHRLGHPVETHLYLDDARQWHDHALAGGTRGLPPGAAGGPVTDSETWADFDRVEFEHLRREAESLIGKPPLSAADALGWARRFAARHRLGQADRAEYAFDRAAKAAGALVVPTDRRIDEVGQPASGDDARAWRELLDGLPDAATGPAWAAQLRVLALASLGEWDRVEAAASDALRAAPADARMLQDRARARAALGRWPDALADLSGLRKDALDAPWWYLRGAARSRTGDPDGAVEDLTLALDLGATDWPVWSERGRARLAVGWPDAAAADFGAALRAHPDPNAPSAAALLLGRGAAHRRQERWDEACADFRRATELMPSSLQAWGFLAASHGGAGRPAEALAAWTRATELAPDNWHVWHNRGACHQRVGEPDKALADLTRAAELAPREKAPWRARGQIHIQAREWEKAAADMTRVIELDPKDALAWYHRGCARREAKDWDRAVTDLSRAVELDPKVGGYWEGRGNAYGSMGRWDRAAADFARAAELLPDEPGVRFRDAILRLRGGDVAGHRAACRAMLARPVKPRTAAAEGVVWACVLAPGAVDDYAPVVALAGLETWKRQDPRGQARAAGAALYRASKLAEAVRTLEEATSAEAAPLTDLFLAMAYHRLGDPDRAAGYRRRARGGSKEVAGGRAGAEWTDRVMLEIIRREAEALLSGTGAGKKP